MYRTASSTHGTTRQCAYKSILIPSSYTKITEVTLSALIYRHFPEDVSSLIGTKYMLSFVLISEEKSSSRLH